jgi:hypothetical protein
MKKLAILSVLGAFIFGFNGTPVQAGNNGTENAVVIISGTAQAAFNDVTEVITLRMASAQRQERVSIILSSNATGQTVFEDKLIVDNKGAVLEIPMAGLKAGMYTLRVNGQTIKLSDRFKKK